MNKAFRLIVISECSKPSILHVEYFSAPHLTKAIVKKCINIVYNHASLDDWRVFAYLDDLTKYAPVRIAEIMADTSCMIWPDRIPTTAIYINNKYIRTMGKKVK